MLIQQSLEKPRKQASCVALDVNLLANQCRYGYKAAYIKKIC